jgi:hypothetical protein
MKLLVRSVLTIFLLAGFKSIVPAQSKCTCRPSPPGGTTQCKSEEIAICGDGGDGTCHGQCIEPPEPSRGRYDLDFSAFLVGKILQKDISTRELERNSDTFNQILAKLINSSGSDKTVKVQYKGQQENISVGLSDDAKKLLESAQTQLAGSTREETPQNK